MCQSNLVGCHHWNPDEEIAANHEYAGYRTLSGTIQFSSTLIILMNG